MRLPSSTCHHLPKTEGGDWATCRSDGGAHPEPGRPGPEPAGCRGIASTRSPSLEGLTLFHLQPHARLPEVVLRGNKRTSAVLRPVPLPSGGATLSPAGEQWCSPALGAGAPEETGAPRAQPPRWAAPHGPQGASPSGSLSRAASGCFAGSLGPPEGLGLWVQASPRPCLPRLTKLPSGRS